MQKEKKNPSKLHFPAKKTLQHLKKLHCNYIYNVLREKKQRFMQLQVWSNLLVMQR